MSDGTTQLDEETLAGQAEPAPQSRRGRLLQRWLRFPRVLWLALLLGGLLLLPSVGSGFVYDDYFYLVGLGDLAPAKVHPLRMFEFVPKDVALTRHRIRQGFFPWWTAEELKIKFLRPLSSGLIWFDISVFGKWAAGHHLHSIAWLLGLLAVWGALLRKRLPETLAGLTLIVLAMDEAHVVAAAWISNRNALVAALPVSLGLLFHLRWREDGWRWGLPLSVLAYTVGLMGGEAAVSMLAYLAAYELFGNRGNLASKAKGLAPALLLGLAYVTIYKLGQYGTNGSGLYIDPIGEPAAYFRGLGSNICVLLGDLLLGFPAHMWTLFPKIRPYQIALGLSVTAGFVWALRASLRGLDATSRRHVRWLVAGAVLSLLPVAATAPASRLLVPASLGTSVALALVISQAFRSLRTVPQRRVLTVTAWMFLIVHLLLAPLMKLQLQVMLGQFAQQAVQAAADAELGEQPRQTDYVLLGPTNFTIMTYIPMILRTESGTYPGSWRAISVTPNEHRFRRLDDHTLEVEIEGGMFQHELELLYRARTPVMQVGDQVDAGPLDFEVLEMGKQGPSRLAVAFDRPLDDPSLRFLVWQDDKLRAVSIPPAGETLTTQWSMGPGGL